MMDAVVIRKALWSEITHVLLDMDGTLVDKYFDDYFWRHLVPEKYAEKHGITFGAAKEQLFVRYKAREGTLNWTDIDFWSNELDLDIPALNEQVRHLLEAHPNVEDFLTALRIHKKTVVLATNAHYKTIAFKMKHTELGKYFDKVIMSSDMGYPKEDEGFWINAQRAVGFDKDRTLFIDDTREVAESAARFGIKYVLIKHMASSREDAEYTGTLPYINNFSELLP
ncbi:GMP/IMP nucleotidase [Candidatus Magnetominusculus xianensis]|uniref:Haloacid dehalogenase n=1 Tax=Candidatus Magnetominusculus xianensis TaxID=1748249 RepID=A0ABR5SGE1_9BACT|nr:GMP/IMP nucleotidase [Candidatus Magnetominusculus xianensis]KWT88504.1 haloacid dehalogenase [Candidatus Magnetominusculus xianensis]